MAANEQKSLSVTEWTKKIGRIGGKARLTKMTAEERSRIARLAARARWGKKTAAPDPNPPDPQDLAGISNGRNQVLCQLRADAP